MRIDTVVVGVKECELHISTNNVGTGIVYDSIKMLHLVSNSFLFLCGPGEVIDSLNISCLVLCGRTDKRYESVTVGKGAVEAAISGKTGVMMTIERAVGEDYVTIVRCADIAGIANAIKTVPDEYINEDGNGITEAGIEYLKPLIMGELSLEYVNGLPKHFVI